MNFIKFLRTAQLLQQPDQHNNPTNIGTIGDT